MSLVDRLKRKEELALVELMHLYGDYLLRMAFLLLKDHQTAEEAVQDTFLIAFEKISQLENEAVLKSWLTTITMNRCREQMRKWNWKSIFLNFDIIERFNESETSPGPEDNLLEVEWNQHITTAIQQLDYKYREVITLFYFNELKITEIAALTGSKENTVKSRLKRGKQQLKQILENKEEANNGRKKGNQETS